MQLDNGNFDIPACNLEALTEAIAKMNRRAAKLDCQPITLRVVREFEVEKKNEHTKLKYMQARLEIEVQGETPKFEGWSLLAAVEMQENGENLVRCVPGRTVPESFRTTDTHCDHCKSDRRRKEIFILGHEDGRFAQVGRQCIADFLGHVSAEKLAARACWEFSAMEAVDAADADDYCGGGGLWVKDITEYLGTVAICIRRLGWVSRSMLEKKGDYEGSTTSSTAWNLLTSKSEYVKEFIAKHDLHAEERDMTLAAEALAWARNLPVAGVSDYEYNLGVACRQTVVSYRTIGIVASVISAYQRFMEKEEELNIRRKQDLVRKHVGEVGRRQDFANVTVKSMRFFESVYGVKTLVRFEDAEGNVLIWWASKALEDDVVGDVVDIRGTVVKHDDYKGCPQTELKRVQIIEKVQA